MLTTYLQLEQVRVCVCERPHLQNKSWVLQVSTLAPPSDFLLSHSLQTITQLSQFPSPSHLWQLKLARALISSSSEPAHCQLLTRQCTDSLHMRAKNFIETAAKEWCTANSECRSNGPGIYDMYWSHSQARPGTCEPLICSCQVSFPGQARSWLNKMGEWPKVGLVYV